jgi:flagellar hook-basal body complex protein FliE
MDPLLNLSQLPGLKPLGELGQAALPGQAAPTEGTSFSDILKQAMQEVSEAQSTAEQEARKLMTGEATDMHTAILAVQKADVSFQMMMAVRGKLIDAYREVMRMQM